ncbi:MAG: hypothetical protein ABJF09_08960 [Qipengyuania citrea]|uniref:hypothetical protein n=1 Tax=Qipengyuania citrea TaxID=225971 RepID=UPI003263B442
MNRPGLRLPSRVTLPAAPLMAGWYVRDALRVSKQVLHLWRARQGFPPFHREGREFYTSTDAIAEWLEARGVKVVRQ